MVASGGSPRGRPEGPDLTSRLIDRHLFQPTQLTWVTIHEEMNPRSWISTSVLTIWTRTKRAKLPLKRGSCTEINLIRLRMSGNRRMPDITIPSVDRGRGWYYGLTRDYRLVTN